MNDTYRRPNTDPSRPIDGGSAELMQLALELERLGDVWAEKRGMFLRLDNRKKAFLAQLTNKMRASDPEMSRREAQDLAEGSDEWEQFLSGLSEAETEMNFARVAYEGVKARFEAQRTADATRRAAMTMR